eukprot:maker-scaffold_15-snap-gene-7.48-mRNA-1 protein AED:0.02 eAED:0.02 QI:133/1/1/1/1/1/3/162/218
MPEEAKPDAGADESAAADFQPLYKAEKRETKTLEEDEVVIFKMRAKLFVFVKEDVYGGEKRENFWKERGTGDVKLLKHKKHGKVRLLMRQDKTLKICANHLVSPHVVLSPNVSSDRSWVFTASDFATEELVTETFAIRFKDAEKANGFKDKVELAKLINAGEKSPDEAKELVDDEEQETEKKKEGSKADEVDKVAEQLGKVEVADEKEEEKQEPKQTE